MTSLRRALERSQSSLISRLRHGHEHRTLPQHPINEISAARRRRRMQHRVAAIRRDVLRTLVPFARNRRPRRNVVLLGRPELHAHGRRARISGADREGEQLLEELDAAGPGRLVDQGAAGGVTRFEDDGRVLVRRSADLAQRGSRTRRIARTNEVEPAGSTDGKFFGFWFIIGVVAQQHC